jgi:hypothetical protein
MFWPSTFAGSSRGDHYVRGRRAGIDLADAVDGNDRLDRVVIDDPA